MRRLLPLLLALGACAPEPTASRLPRWRGFNLDDRMEADNAEPYREEDFKLIARWGFDFVRLPLDYRSWTREGTLDEVDTEGLAELDRALEWGRRYRLHVSLNLHRAPGWCINPPAEPLSLWEDEAAQAAFEAHWAMLARRYRGIPNRRLSFNLLNEPDGVGAEEYAEVLRGAVEAVRREDPRRLIIVDGLDLASKPVPGIEDLGVAQSFHAYLPWELSAHRAPWIPRRDWPPAAWPMDVAGERWDKARLRRELAPWLELRARGVGVHVGEFGSFNRTPHPAMLAWMKDWLELFEQYRLGWSLWNLRGEFGPLDSGRRDAPYEPFGAHHLDRQMLDLLQSH